MDDFLHNLRSGKLKQADRGRRDYNDYKGPQRRASNDRRKTDYYAKVTNENFALIKETLDALAASQKRIADAMVQREKTQERIADALETIARKMEDPPKAEEATFQSDATVRSENEGKITESLLSTESFNAHPDPEQPDAEDRPNLIGMISTMRDHGDSWEKIARHFDEHNIPTVSGKGKWRGPAIKKFWTANA
jgi:hypothetical protein